MKIFDFCKSFFVCFYVSCVLIVIMILSELTTTYIYLGTCTCALYVLCMLLYIIINT